MLLVNDLAFADFVFAEVPALLRLDLFNGRQLLLAQTAEAHLSKGEVDLRVVNVGVR